MANQTVLNKEQQYLKVFQEVTKLISMVLDPQQVMDLVVSRLPELLDVDAATIRLLDSSTNTFVLGAAHGLSDEYLSRSAIDTHDSMQMIMNGQPVAKTALQKNQLEQITAEAVREGIKGVLSLPIIFQGHIIGVMRLLTREERVFNSQEISFSMALAEQIGMALSNGRLFKEMENQVDFLTGLREISKVVNSTLNLDEILKTIVDMLPRIMGMKACTIRLLQPETNELELVAASGLSAEYLKRGRIKKENSIFKALKGEAVAIFDAESDPRVVYHDVIRREGIKSILAVPIKVGREIIGVLRLLTTDYHCFSNSEVTFATTVAEEGGNAIENARTYQKINLLFNQIEENERFLQNILDSLWTQLVVMDTRKHVVMVNKRFLEQQGLDENEVLGQTYHFCTIPMADQGAGCLADKVLTSGERVTSIDTLTHDGKEQWLERSLSPIVDDAGNVEFVIEAVRDITASRQLEEEKLARVKLEGVLEMAGTAAHELNTPLFAALGTAQLMWDDLQQGEMREDMDLIIRNLQTISSLTRKMTTMTGFESKDYVGETKIIELR
ncbi:MAG: GAF domain-containing protein [Desulfobulbaceae bacterium]|nr:GAF domain-containing protein [Desulfobulbaceae bacterium]